MKKLLALLLAIVMVLSLIACSAFSNDPTEPAGPTDPSDPTNPTNPIIPEVNKFGGHLDFCVYAKPTHLDPAKATGTWYYMYTNMVYESPLTRDAEGNIRPNVCNFELSKDQLTLKLWVREGLKFHDGSLVEIEDVVASIRRTVHKSPSQFVDAYIQDVKIENGVATITFKEYNEKTMYYIDSVNPLIGVMPKEIAEEYSNESGKFIVDVADAIGTGPYKFTELVDSVSVSVARFDDYIPVEEGYTGYAAPKKAYLDSVTFHANSEASTSTLALMSGQFDLFADCPADFDDQLKAAGIETLNKPQTSGAVFFMNTHGNGVASNPNMRKAMLAAIDIPEFVSFMTDGEFTKGGYCPAVDDIYYTDVFEKADYMGEDNVALAQQYMAAADYNGEEVQLALGSAYANVATLLADYFDAAGIKYKVTMLETGATKDFYTDKNNVWDIYYTSPSLNNTPTLLSNTIMKDDYKGAEKDALLAELQGMVVGSEEYMNKWYELANQMVEDCGVAFLHRNNIVWAFNSEFNLEYDGISTYLFNSYWTNPENHGK